MMIPLAYGASPIGLFHLLGMFLALYSGSAHLLSFLFWTSFLAALIPLGFPTPMLYKNYSFKYLFLESVYNGS